MVTDSEFNEEHLKFQPPSSTTALLLQETGTDMPSSFETVADAE
jgi:hypothetical protein